MAEELVSKYVDIFGKSTNGKVETLFIPYRICPLGAHIDHQSGIVIGTTIEEGIYFTFTINNKAMVRLYSADYNDYIEFSINEALTKTGNWYDYVKGAVCVLKEMAGNLKYGFNAVIKASFPGGGLSSSAAVAIGYLLLLQKANGIEVPPEENVKLVQRIENYFIGLNNGILDQSMILLSSTEKSSLVYLDCKTVEYKTIIPEKDMDFEVVIVYSGIEKTLSNTGYNIRVKECETAAELLLEMAEIKLPTSSPENKKQIKLRDVPEEIFERYKDKLPENLKKRATHFFTEMERVRKGATLWEKGDLENFGRLVTESGKSSIENYECGSPALIKIYDVLKSTEGVYGVRFSGAGFRGSCIGIIKPLPEIKEQIKEKIRRYYMESFPQYARDCKITFCRTNRIPFCS